MRSKTEPRTAPRRRWRVAAALAAVPIAAATALTFATPAGAASSQIHASYIKYSFQNWDYDGGSRDNPVSIIFVSNSPNMVSRVYSQVGSVGLSGGGDKMTLSGIGGSRPGVNPRDPWTSHSAGRKGAFGCWGHCGSKTDIHVRTYGPDGRWGTQVYQGSYGYRPYYLIATIHFDVNENTSHSDFGYQDRARSLLVNKLVAAHKWTVLTSVAVQNACNRRTDAHHLCRHDGRAWLISIDG
jgi:hypothetical protein